MSETESTRVRSYDTGDERRIAVNMGRGEHGLSIAEATVLRDQLTAALGAPQALTDREAMVWATVYATAGGTIGHAARRATESVAMLRVLEAHPGALDEETCAMLAAMTGGGR